MPLPSLTLVRRFRASPARVWAAVSQAEQMALWWGPDAGPVLHARADVRVGGRINVRFRMLDGSEHEMSGVYREVEPERRLVFGMHWHEFPERESEVTMTLAPVEGGVEFTLHHAQLHDDAVRDAHVEGWTGSLEKLQTLLETLPETAG